MGHRKKCEKMIDLFLDLVPVIVLEMDTRGHIHRINRMGCDLLGKGKNELLGRNFFRIAVPMRFRERVERKFREYILAMKDTPQEFEMPLISFRGERTIVWNCMTVHEGEGHISGMVCAGKDVTEEKRIEKLARMNEEEVNEMVHHIESISNRIRNPLGVIVGLADLEGGSLGEKMLHEAGEITTLLTHLNIRKVSPEEVQEYLQSHYQNQNFNS